MKLFREYTTRLLLKRAREAVGTTIALYHSRKTPVLMLAAGGSARDDLLSGIMPLALGPNLTVAVLDERASLDPEVNNFSQLSATIFYSEAVAAGAQVIDTRMLPGDTASLLAKRFEDALRAWK